MSRVTLGASEALARFVAGPHDDAAFEAALEPARVRLLAALSALEMPNDSSALAARALASYGAPLRRAFVEGTRLGAAPVARADAPIVAAALTASALAGHGETDVLAAIAVGREVAARLSRALTLDAPWNATAVIAGIAATAAAARATGLDAEAARNALGLAATQAAGLGAADATVAELACGKAAADAVEAALLARYGFTAAPASLEGRRGLAALMGSHLDEALLSEDLGRRWFSAAG